MASSIPPLGKKIRPLCKNGIFNTIYQNKTEFWSHTSTEICENSRFSTLSYRKIKKTCSRPNTVRCYEYTGGANKQNILRIQPLFGPFWEIWPKSGLRFVRPLIFLFGFFWVLRLKLGTLRVSICSPSHSSDYRTKFCPNKNLDQLYRTPPWTKPKNKQTAMVEHGELNSFSMTPCHLDSKLTPFYPFLKRSRSW